MPLPFPVASAPSSRAETPEAVVGAPARRARRWELDALRGLMLAMMLSTHLPTRFSVPFGQPLGFVSAAEGFVMLSAYMAGLVYTQRAAREGIPAMRRAFLRRATVIYACQAGSLVFLFTVIAALGIRFQHPEASNLMWFYLREPVTALWASLLLIYNPPLLDILPVYVMFMLLSPWILSYGLQKGWRNILAISMALWLAAQFGASRFLYDGLVALTGLPVPFRETGAFETFAWQFLWIFGLWLGSRHAKGDRIEFPRKLVAAAGAFCATFLVWRHLTGQEPFPMGHPLNAYFDKWHLGPMRLLGFFSLLVLAMYFGKWLKRRLPRIRPLEALGAASLPVFCVHLAIVLLALALFGGSTPSRPLMVDAAMFGVSLFLLWVAARVTLRLDTGSWRPGRSAPGPLPASLIERGPK